MATLLDLPNESLTTICAHLTQPDLAALVRVNRRLHELAERLLYTTIAILDSLDDAPTGPPHPRPRRTLACAVAVTARPHLAANTRRLTVRWMTTATTTTTRDRARTAYAGAGGFAPEEALNALHALVHATSPSLDALELHLAGLPPHLDVARLLLPSSPFDNLAAAAAAAHGGGAGSRLRRLALTGAPDAHNLEHVLRAHPSLVHLHLGGDTAPRALMLAPAPVDLPHLASFRGDARAAVSLLPGRPITALVLSTSGHAHALGVGTGAGAGGGGGGVGNAAVTEPSDTLLRACACTTRPIRRLDLGALAVTPTQLLAIAKHLPQLVALRMRLALRHTLHFTFSGMMLLSALTPALSSFPHLTSLDLSPTAVDGIASSTPTNARREHAEERALCDAWAGACPRLRRVRFPSGGEWEWVWVGAGAGNNNDGGRGGGGGGGGGDEEEEEEEGGGGGGGGGAVPDGNWSWRRIG